jgi:aminoglycoside/choline kinase family phosphotransferase
VFETWVHPFAEQSGAGNADQFRARFEEILHQTTAGEKVMILRDYHAENLLWLPDRNGVARVGLLDFQDAMIAHPAYDLVSLLQDVRRDVTPAVELAMVERYIKRTGQYDHTFRTAYAVLGVQRNLRILAVFARLASKLGKPYYASLIHRPWAHIMRGLEHPTLAPIASMLIDTLAPPTPANLQKLVQA